jgi:hypothetical protein
VRADDCGARVEGWVDGVVDGAVLVRGWVGTAVGAAGEAVAVAAGAAEVDGVVGWVGLVADPVVVWPAGRVLCVVVSAGLLTEKAPQPPTVAATVSAASSPLASRIASFDRRCPRDGCVVAIPVPCVG